MNQRRWDGSLGSGKGWMEKMRFQVSAECCESFARKPRTDVRGATIPDSRSCRTKTSAPNEMSQRVTERRLAETDRRFLDGVCHWNKLARYGGLQVYIALWVIVAILNLIRSWIGNQCSRLKVARLEVRLGLRLPPTTRARVFWIDRNVIESRFFSSLRGRQPLNCLALRPPIGPNALPLINQLVIEISWWFLQTSRQYSSVPVLSR